MLEAGRVLVLPLAAVSQGTRAQEAAPKSREFPSRTGSGRVVVVISGPTGMAAYAGVARQFADAGFSGRWSTATISGSPTTGARGACWCAS